MIKRHKVIVFMVNGLFKLKLLKLGRGEGVLTGLRYSFIHCLRDDIGRAGFTLLLVLAITDIAHRSLVWVF